MLGVAVPPGLPEPVGDAEGDPTEGPGPREAAPAAHPAASNPVTATTAANLLKRFIVLLLSRIDSAPHGRRGPKRPHHPDVTVRSRVPRSGPDPPLGVRSRGARRETACPRLPRFAPRCLRPPGVRSPPRWPGRGRSRPRPSTDLTCRTVRTGEGCA